VYIQPVDVHFSSTVILLSMMAFYWLTLVLILWKERLFSILNIAALIIQMAGIVILNHVALNGIMLFLIGAVPAVVILICNAIEKDSNNANIQPSEK
jgi:predicted neutral ceramidase superfamily lipid hydrolase